MASMWIIEELASTSRAEQINAILLNTITQVVVLSKILWCRKNCDSIVYARQQW